VLDDATDAADAHSLYSLSSMGSIRRWANSQIFRARSELRVCRLLLKDERTPRAAKWMLGIAIAYLATPFDIIPDFIPVLGHLDDVVIVPTLIFVALKLIPDSVIADCRALAAQPYDS
jgi:uncharacterized membrane protein YkvA (DUF1232 family)